MKTSYYANLRNIDLTQNVPIAISVDSGRLAKFRGKSMKCLSPAPFFKKWKQIETNIDANFKRGDFNKFTYDNLKKSFQAKYVEAFYNKVLKKLEPRKVFDALGENTVLLCYEKPTDFCHRFLVAGWLELSLGVVIDEAAHEKDKAVQENKESLKNQLKKVMENAKEKAGRSK